MKIQDVLFIVILLIVIYKRDLRLMVLLGLGSLLLSIPLFVTWTFFTAERLTWYAAGFFVLAIILNLLSNKNER